MPFPFPGDLSKPGIKPRSPSLQADSLPAEAQGKSLIYLTWMIFTIIYLVLQVTVYISYFTLLGCKFLEGRNDFLIIFEYLSTTLLSNSTELSHSILCDGYFFNKMRSNKNSVNEKEMNMIHRICCCSVTKLCPTLYNSMNCSRPGFPVIHHLPEFAQIHVH